MLVSHKKIFIERWVILILLGQPVTDDDYAAAVLSESLGKPTNVTSQLRTRALVSAFTLFNNETGFMEARNADGSWAGEDRGWTEGKLAQSHLGCRAKPPRTLHQLAGASQ